jgi:hypothetical protein
MASKKRQQTINKRNREREVAEKRALKLQRKQEKREAARNGGVDALGPALEGEPMTAEGEATAHEGTLPAGEGEPPAREL